MGFSKEEVRRLNFKVQAGNVIDADSGNYWYQASLENQPSVKPARILSQFSTVAANPPANFADAVTLTQAGQPLNGIVADGFTSTSTRLTILTPGLIILGYLIILIIQPDLEEKIYGYLQYQ
tara:strand:+ start:2233 stop:2598 length:366 start_codon:yes stop_codon:yes gene_type:complete